MFQTYEDFPQLFCVYCKDVGLDCNCNTYGISDETVVYNTISHMLEYHAIKPEEMTTCMKLKILGNVQAHQSPPPTSHSSYNNGLSECRA